MPGFLENIGAGAASGAALGPWGAIGGAALGALPSLVSLFTGGAQRRRARAINPVDPGFVANQGLLDNKEILNNQYNNYQLPGKSAILDTLGTSFANGMNGITQGATSSEDILGGVTNLNYNQNQSLLNLGITEAEMKNAMLPAVLQSNAAAGNEAVRRNQFEEERYQADLARKAGLEQAGAINQYKGLDNLASLGGSLLNYNAQPWTRNQGYKL